MDELGAWTSCEPTVRVRVGLGLGLGSGAAMDELGARVGTRLEHEPSAHVEPPLHTWVQVSEGEGASSGPREEGKRRASSCRRRTAQCGTCRRACGSRAHAAPVCGQRHTSRWPTRGLCNAVRPSLCCTWPAGTPSSSTRYLRREVPAARCPHERRRARRSRSLAPASPTRCVQSLDVARSPSRAA